MGRAALHYFFDAYCAWCYAVSELLTKTGGDQPPDVILHVSNLYPYPNPFPSPKATALENFLEESRTRNPQVIEASGLPFSDRFKTGKLKGEGAVLDSSWPNALVLAAEEVAGNGVLLLSRMHKRIFADGEILTGRALSELARAVAVDEKELCIARDNIRGRVEQHVSETRRLMKSLKEKGYPILALDRDGSLVALDFVPYLKDADRFRSEVFGQA